MVRLSHANSANNIEFKLTNATYILKLSYPMKTFIPTFANSSIAFIKIHNNLIYN